MATRLNPYISFGDTAREAMTFYQQVLGGNLELHTFSEYGGGEEPFADLIMHGVLETEDGLSLMGADTPPGMETRSGNNITISLSGDDGDKLHGYWEALSQDGTVGMPLEKQMWGDEFGMCVDKFGIPWMVNIAGGQ